MSLVDMAALKANEAASFRCFLAHCSSSFFSLCALLAVCPYCRCHSLKTDIRLCALFFHITQITPPYKVANAMDFFLIAILLLLHQPLQIFCKTIESPKSTSWTSSSVSSTIATSRNATTGTTKRADRPPLSMTSLSVISRNDTDETTKSKVLPHTNSGSATSSSITDRPTRSISRVSSSTSDTSTSNRPTIFKPSTARGPITSTLVTSARITTSRSRAHTVTSYRTWHQKNSTAVRGTGSTASGHAHQSGLYPTGNYPSGIFPSGQYPSGIFPSGLFPSGVVPSGYHPSGHSGRNYSSSRSSMITTRSSIRTTSPTSSHGQISKQSSTSSQFQKNSASSVSSTTSPVPSTTSTIGNAEISNASDPSSEDMTGGAGMINGTEYPWNPTNATCNGMNNLNSSQIWSYVDGDSVVQSFNSMYAGNQLMCSECFGMDKGACTSTDPRCQNGLQDLAKPPGSPSSRWDTGAAIFAQNVDLADLNCDIGSTECSGAPSCSDSDGPGAFALLKCLETCKPPSSPIDDGFNDPSSAQYPGECLASHRGCW